MEQNKKSEEEMEADMLMARYRSFHSGEFSSGRTFVHIGPKEKTMMLEEAEIHFKGKI